MTIEALDLPAGEKAIVSLQLPAAFLIVFDPVTHTAQFLDVKGEPTRERQILSVIFDRDMPQYPPIEMRPGPLRIAMENRTDSRVLPTIFVADDPLHDFIEAPAAVPDGKATAVEPDLPRHLPDRHARCRPAVEDHQPDLPVHRSPRLDRAL